MTGYRLRVVFKDHTSKIVPEKFETQKNARAYAYAWAKAVPNVAFFELKVKDGKEVQTIGVDNGTVYVSYLDNYGNYHHDIVNKDGTIRK